MNRLPHAIAPIASALSAAASFDGGVQGSAEGGRRVPSSAATSGEALHSLGLKSRYGDRPGPISTTLAKLIQ